MAKPKRRKPYRRQLLERLNLKALKILETNPAQYDKCDDVQTQFLKKLSDLKGFMKRNKKFL